MAEDTIQFQIGLSFRFHPDAEKTLKLVHPVSGMDAALSASETVLLLQWLYEHQEELAELVANGDLALKLHDRDKIEGAIHTLLGQLPEHYPSRILELSQDGYQLLIGSTLIYRGQNADEALKRTQRYVAERDGHPNLPVGVIDGVYD